MSENYDNNNQRTKNTEMISDEVLEHIYGDLADLRELLERNRATTELTQSLVLELRKEIEVIKATLGLNNLS